jgi:hypothetical protein
VPVFSEVGVEGTERMMAVDHMDGYYVGQRGWIDVLDAAGEGRRWVEGSIGYGGPVV